MAKSTEEEFVNVWFGNENEAIGEPHDSNMFYQRWLAKSSAPHSWPNVPAHDALRKLYPHHSVVLTTDYRMNLMAYPGALVEPLKDVPLVANTLFLSLPRNSSPKPGLLLDDVEFGAFKVSWNEYEFLHFVIKYPFSLGTMISKFILHEGPEDPIRSLMLTVGIWANALHNEIWVFDGGYWRKDAALYTEIQKANWEDVILDRDFKKTFKKDVYGFFESEELYKKLAIPWKRGIIMYGPPGNGKTISLKAIMKDCGALGYAPLYVKSFKSFMGEEYSMSQVFNKARELSPCVVVLEDLDSLINDANRSFFLNQMDGLSGNDGLLVIGTTNHFERLDPGLSSRPSRFDRKFYFGDPSRDERALYCKYWQNKLKDNKEVDFPNSLVDDIAGWTDRFSFAYLKEAFVSSLVLYAGFEGKDKPSFASVIHGQIKALRKQLGTSPEPVVPMQMPATTSTAKQADSNSDIRSILNRLSVADQRTSTSKVFTTDFRQTPNVMVPNQPQPSRQNTNLADSMKKMFTTHFPGSTVIIPDPPPQFKGGDTTERVFSATHAANFGPLPKVGPDGIEIPAMTQPCIIPGSYNAHEHFSPPSAFMDIASPVDVNPSVAPDSHIPPFPTLFSGNVHAGSNAGIGYIPKFT